MINLLIRGLPINTKLALVRMASKRNLSVNQLVIEILMDTIRKREEEGKRDKKKQMKLSREIDKLRERLHRKYGPQEEAWKLIREDRGPI
jgi:hypothetical protein